MAQSDAAKLDQKLDELADELPNGIRKPLTWLRSPTGRWVRIPVALLLIAGGCVGFLPILGFWMVPLGLILLALDVPFLQKPVLQAVTWMQRQWLRLKAWWQRRRARA